MAFALVSSVIGGYAQNQPTTTSIDTTGANLIILAVNTSYNFGTPTDSKSNTYTALTAHGNSTDKDQLFYCLNPTVGTGHTFTVPIDNVYGNICAAAFSGAASSSVFDVENGGLTYGVTTMQTGSVTPSEDNELVFYSSYSTTGISSVDVGTLIGESYPGGIAYQIQTTATARNPTFTYPSSTYAAASIATFKAAAGGGVTVAPAAAIARALGIAPTTVLGSMSYTPSPAVARSAAVAPTTILGSLVITPAVAGARALAQIGAVVLGSLTITPAVAAAKVAAVVGAVIGGGGLVVTAAAAIARALAVAPSVLLGSVSVTPAPAIARGMARIGAVVASGATTVYARIVRPLVRALVRDNNKPGAG